MMKVIYLLIGILITPICYAALPDIVTDPATRDTIEYLDAKYSKTETTVNSFSQVNSTVTVQGTLDIGLELLSSSAGSTTAHTQSCSAGKKLLGGGCAITAGGVMIGSFPADADTWQCSANASSSIYAYAICARLK